MRKIAKQVNSTRQLRKEKQSDHVRWNKPDQLFEDWNERTGILASMVRSGSVVIEFGAGNMALKSLLPQGCRYTPSDIVKRNPDFLKCDLNEEIPFDLSAYDTAVLSGVLEYVYDIDNVFKQFPENMKNILLSYSCKDISHANRLENGWLSDYSKKEMDAVFEKYDYQIVEYKEWRNQSLFSLRKALKKRCCDGATE
ncbi:class I SAM-dependent methyltransferase [Gillisia sp. Q332]|uniref:class I SAM-dependent methyltransferase n=1 Tax=Gillisia xinjiangensis TaxID=3384765 RepID=UPI00391C3D61